MVFPLACAVPERRDLDAYNCRRELHQRGRKHNSHGISRYEQSRAEKREACGSWWKQKQHIEYFDCAKHVRRISQSQLAGSSSLLECTDRCRYVSVLRAKLSGAACDAASCALHMHSVPVPDFQSVIPSFAASLQPLQKPTARRRSLVLRDPYILLY